MAGHRAEKLNAIAARHGFNTYHEYRMFKKGAEAAGAQTVTTPAGRVVNVSGGQAAGGRRQVFNTPAGTIVKTTSKGKGRALIESRAAKLPAATEVRLLVTFTRPDGTDQTHDVVTTAGVVAQGVDAVAIGATVLKAGRSGHGPKNSWHGGGTLQPSDITELQMIGPA